MAERRGGGQMCYNYTGICDLASAALLFRNSAYNGTFSLTETYTLWKHHSVPAREIACSQVKRQRRWSYLFRACFPERETINYGKTTNVV
jgi:hypothetical protein